VERSRFAAKKLAQKTKKYGFVLQLVEERLVWQVSNDYGKASAFSSCLSSTDTT